MSDDTPLTDSDNSDAAPSGDASTQYRFTLAPPPPLTIGGPVPNDASPGDFLTNYRFSMVPPPAEIGDANDINTTDGGSSSQYRFTLAPTPLTIGPTPSDGPAGYPSGQYRFAGPVTSPTPGQDTASDAPKPDSTSIIPGINADGSVAEPDMPGLTVHPIQRFVPFGPQDGSAPQDGTAPDPEETDPQKQRQRDADQYERQQQAYLEQARQEQQIAVHNDLSQTGDSPDYHFALSHTAAKNAMEMGRRADILRKGTPDNYRELVFKEYNDTPNINGIMAFYAAKFGDQGTLNYLARQHPAVPQDFDPTDLALLLLGDKIGPEGVPAEEGPAMTSLPEAEEDVAAALKPYREGAGHHIPAKSAFVGDPAYDLDEALAIPNADLKARSIHHPEITGAQRQLYLAYAKTGKELTWEAMQTIETTALQRAGMDAKTAAATVSKAIDALKASGVSRPTRIPWASK